MPKVVVPPHRESCDRKPKPLTCRRPRPAAKTWQISVGSACGGLVEAVLSNQWRVLKTVRQTHNEKNVSMLESWQALGPRRMQGIGLHIALNVPTHVLYYSLQNLFAQHLKGRRSRPRVRHAALAGAMAGAVQAVLASPICRVQVMQDAGHLGIRGMNTGQALAHLSRTEGVKSLYRGCGVAALHHGVQLGLYFGMLTWGLRALGEGPAQNLVVGAGAEACAAVLSHPADTVLSRLRLGTTHASALGVARNIFVREGCAGFARGMGASVMAVTPSTAVEFTVTQAVVYGLQSLETIRHTSVVTARQTTHVRKRPSRVHPAWWT